MFIYFYKPSEIEISRIIVSCYARKEIETLNTCYLRACHKMFNRVTDLRLMQTWRTTFIEHKLVLVKSY